MNKAQTKTISIVIAIIFCLLLAACNDGEAVSQTSMQGLSEADNTLLENNTPIAAERDYETEEIVLEYSIPEQLGDDLRSFIIELEGDLYRLPAPLSAFLENGWEVTENNEGFIDAYSSSTNVLDLTRNNITIYDIDMVNFDNERKAIEDCYVYGIFVGQTYTFWGENERSGDVALILPGGVTIGDNEAEVTSVYNDMISSEELYIRLENDDIIVYEYLGVYNRNIQLYITKESRTVINIQIQNDSSQNLR